jgi:hypothetical protein
MAHATGHHGLRAAAALPAAQRRAALHRGLQRAYPQAGAADVRCHSIAIGGVMRFIGLRAVAGSALLGVACVAAATSPNELLRDYETAARVSVAGFDGFSAERGAAFFRSVHGRDWSCATCHGEQPIRAGRHAVTGKTITPLAPAANPARFTDAADVEKWFRRNCRDVVGRACSAREKGDVLTFLSTLGGAR